MLLGVYVWFNNDSLTAGVMRTEPGWPAFRDAGLRQVTSYKPDKQVHMCSSYYERQKKLVTSVVLSDFSVP